VIVSCDDLIDHVGGQVCSFGYVSEATPVRHQSTDQVCRQGGILSKPVQHRVEVNRPWGIFRQAGGLSSTESLPTDRGDITFLA
jgi:hypothetical protein